MFKIGKKHFIKRVFLTLSLQNLLKIKQDDPSSNFKENNTENIVICNTFKN